MAVPPRLIDEHMVVIGGLLHVSARTFCSKQDGLTFEPLKFDRPHYVQHGLKGYEYPAEGVDGYLRPRLTTCVGLTKNRSPHRIFRFRRTTMYRESQ